ncbi:DUF5988 family protein [Streptacidiphilus sp. EB129]|uniref:DUF5988 family protein n=1 Tax=Streptacidiphilus sp. EB129 TaxID=3156262 RepID=UPI003517AA00
MLVLLRGGPDDLPQIWEVSAYGADDRIKVPRLNGYEHFEFFHEFEEIGGMNMPVYRWSYRTAIAE